LLNGIGRAGRVRSGQLAEAVVRVDDLPRVRALAFVNSLRGWIDADLNVPQK
jgi:para-aminobenzoate synthetase/4-amino-4-deoxychorismate lyase